MTETLKDHPKYSLYYGKPGELWWCNSHGRKATHVNHLGNHCCDPKLGGILLPCFCVDLTGKCEILPSNENP